MKEKIEVIPFIKEEKKKVIFQVLGKKHQLDYNPKDYYQSQKKKKKLFILHKPINNNININITETKICNENNININVNNLNVENQTKNISNYQNAGTPVTAPETTNQLKINGIKNLESNKNNNNNFYNNKNINALNKENNNNQQQKNIKRNFGDFICMSEDRIGNGSFGEVLYGVHKYSHKEVAVKVLNADTSQDNIKREISFTKQLQGCPGFPILYYWGFCNKNNIIVESLLGPSLDKLFNFCGRIFPLKTVCLIGIEMIKRLEAMHEKGILHRDLKPNNLAWGNYNNSYMYNNNNNLNNYDKLDINTIYLIDFGLSCTYWDNSTTRRHYKQTTGLNFVGTLRYASLNSHQGIRQSRRDDLESMIYILIYFLKGKLPWQDVKAKNKEERYKCILNIKSKETIDSLCQDIPSEFTELLRYVKSLQFDTKPLYNKFYYSFQYLINKLNSEQTEEKNYNYIWEKKLVDWITKEDEENYDSRLREIQNRIFKGYPIDLKKFANYIIYNNNKILIENMRKKETIYIGDSTESMESNIVLK